MLALTSFITNSSKSANFIKMSYSNKSSSAGSKRNYPGATRKRVTQVLLNTKARSALVITQKTRRIDCLEVFFTVMQTIIQGRRLRVSVDEGLEWISELTI